MKLKFNRNLQLGYGISILLLLVVGCLSYATISKLLSSNYAVEQSSAVIRKLEATMSIMKDAETGQRGFLLTNQAKFLEPYHGAYQKAMSLVDQVKALTNDNPEQQRNVNTIKKILVTRLAVLQALIDKRQRGEAVTEADFNTRKSAMDALRAAIDKAELDEQNLLDQRIAVLHRYSLLSPLTIVIAVCLAIIVSVISYLKVIRDVNEKDRLRRELEIKEDETAAFNEELTAANEEIMASNEELTATNEELFNAREDLASLNRSLEDKVRERTQALAESEEETQALNEELSATNEELAASNEELLTTNEDLAESEQRLQTFVEELKLAKGQLEKSEKLFRSIAVNIPKSLIVVIGRDHRFIAVEGDLMIKMGYDSRDYTGKHPAEVAPAERYEASKALYDRVLAGEQFRVDRRGQTGEDYRVDFVPLKDEAGLIYAGLIIALDITDIKSAEEKSAKLAAIVEFSDDAIISKTLDGIITSWNQAAERMFGYTADEMIGQPVLKLIPETRQDEEPMIIDRIKKGEHVNHFETRRITREGKELDVSLTISPIRDWNGEITGASKIARDISEKKQDELRKSDFIGMVSHELKTPLTSLTALIQVLNQKLQKNEDLFVTSALGKANQQVKKMGTMIKGFLDVSRLESGKIIIDKQPFNLEELIVETVSEAELTVSSHQILVGPCHALSINADRDKIASVISNLISNAVKYSPKGKNITVRCDVIENNAVFSVKDEGMGIKAQDIDKLFERYYRVSTNHTRHISGFGIGLYLSAEIIQRHGGRIWVESESGVGSTFYFSLPLA
jgi:PAS domain S-box-containing protein